MKRQCNKSNIMISAELHRSGLSASDDVKMICIADFLLSAEY